MCFRVFPGGKYESDPESGFVCYGDSDFPSGGHSRDRSARESVQRRKVGTWPPAYAGGLFLHCWERFYDF